MGSLKTGSIVLFFSSVVISKPLFAQSDFGNCNRTGRDLAAFKQPLSDEARSSLLEQVLADLVLLNNEIQKEAPRLPGNLLKQCFSRRKEAFDVGLQYSSESTKSLPSFLKTMGLFHRLFGRHEESYKFFSRISDLNPLDYDTKIESFQSWLNWQTTSLKQKDPSTVTEADIKNIVKGSEDLLKPLIQAANVPTEVKISAIKNKIKIYESFKGRDNKSIADWKSVIELNSRDTDALNIVSEYEFDRNNFTEARKYYLLLAETNTSSLNAKRNFLTILYSQKDFELAREWSSRFLQTTATDPVILSYSAWAHLRSGNYEKALELANKALKKDRSNQVARETTSEVFLENASKALKKGLVSKQLFYLDKAYKTNPSNIVISKTLALALFDSVKNQKNLSAKATKKDFNQISKLLLPVINHSPSDETATLVLIESSLKAKNFDVGQAACNSHLKNIGFFQTSEKLFQCLKVFQAKKNKQKQKEILEKALSLPQFESSKGPLTDEILKIDL